MIFKSYAKLSVKTFNYIIIFKDNWSVFQVGSVRVQFTKSILMKNMVDMVLSAIMYFAVGKCNVTMMLFSQTSLMARTDFVVTILCNGNFLSHLVYKSVD